MTNLATMKHLLFITHLFAGLSLSAATPNVVLIIANAQNTDLGCYGTEGGISPNLDKLAARGLRFTRAYTQHTNGSAARVCTFTGLRPSTLGIVGNYKYAPDLPKDAFTLPKWLSDQGWFTLKAGRIFIREDYATSWDDAMPGPTDADEKPAGMKNVLSVPVTYEEANGKKEPIGGLLVIRRAPIEDADTADGRAARDLIAQMQKAAALKKPVLAVLGLSNPEFRNAVPGVWLDKFKTLTVPEVSAEPQNAPASALIAGILPERQVTPEERRQFTAAYRSQTAFMDAQLGLVLDTLDPSNTIVVFTSMTGFHLGDHGNLWGNRSLYARSAQVPLIIAGPGIASGQVCDRVVELIDLFPTLMAHLGLKSPRKMEGESFAALLKNPAASHDEPALTQVLNYGGHTGTALRVATASYMHWGQEGAELYNLQTDPQEVNNLAGDKAMAAALKRMDALMQKDLQPRSR
jgi:arylsulfatase A-like enzyme